MLIHGIGHHWQGWGPVIDRLATDFDVIACDSPGFGRSPPLPHGVEPTIPAYADAFARFFAESGLDRPHVAGNSMGGAIGLELARRAAVASVTAFSPAGFWTTESGASASSPHDAGHAPDAAATSRCALARTTAGRVALFGLLLGHPERMPPEEAVVTLEAAWAAPAFRGALAAFDALPLRPPRGTARRGRDGGVGTT